MANAKVTTKATAKVWEFASGSNPTKTYQAILYSDGTTSCQCPGWTRRVDANGNRVCQHTTNIETGRADELCISSRDYQQAGLAPAVQKVLAENQEKAAAKKIEFGKRRLAI